MRLVTIFLSCFFVLGFKTYGQIESTGQKPFSFLGNEGQIGNIVSINDELPVIGMPDISATDFELIKNHEDTKIEIFAYPFKVNIQVKNVARIDSLEFGLLYRLALQSKGAYSLNVIFSEFKVPKGARLHIYNEDKSMLIGAFTSYNNKESLVLPTRPVSGDKMILEYFEPYITNTNTKLVIGAINHDFSNFFKLNNGAQRSSTSSGLCNVDINCPPGLNWQSDKQSVCKIIINGNGKCTGTLMNNSTRDGTPYLLTANHCISTQADANGSIFIFNYEATVCGGAPSGNTFTISGSNLVSTNATSDFTLLKLSKKPFGYVNPYYAGWDAQNITKQNVVGIHHPKGDVKKFSNENAYTRSTFYQDVISNNNGDYWMVKDWDVGVTEQGSSGSALFDANHNVIGQLHGGYAACNGSQDNNKPDWYGKFSTSWDGVTAGTRLRDWLNPSQNEITTLSGSGVCSGNWATSLIMTAPLTYNSPNLYQAEQIIATNVIQEGANITYEAANFIELNNGFETTFECEFLAISKDCIPSCNPIKVDNLPNVFTPNGDGINDELCYNNTNATGYSVNIYDRWGNLVYSGSGSSTTNPICVWDGAGACYSCVYFVIITFFNDCDEEVSVSHDVTVFGENNKRDFNTSTPSVQQTEHQGLELEIYPNPARSVVKIRVESSWALFSIRVVNALGEVVVFRNDIRNNELDINVSNLASGIYTVEIESGDVIRRKLLLINN